MPIVGSLNVADAKVVNRGEEYDGVVLLNRAGRDSTGSLSGPPHYEPLTA